MPRAPDCIIESLIWDDGTKRRLPPKTLQPRVATASSALSLILKYLRTQCATRYYKLVQFTVTKSYKLVPGNLVSLVGIMGEYLSESLLLVCIHTTTDITSPSKPTQLERVQGATRKERAAKNSGTWERALCNLKLRLRLQHHIKRILLTRSNC